MATRTIKSPVQSENKDHYLHEIKHLAEQQVPAWLKKLRAKGEKLFLNTPYPHTKMEEWRQTNITPITDAKYHALTQFTKHTLADYDIAPHRIGGNWIELVFVDGYFDSVLSDTAALPKGVIVGSLAEAVTGPAEKKVKKYLGSCFGERSAFTALNTAFLQDGPFLYVPKGVELDRPVHFLCVSNARFEETATHTRALLVLEPMVKAAVAISSVSLGQGEHPLENMVEEIVLGEGAALTRYEIVSTNASARRLCTAEATLAKDSHLESFSVTLGGQIVRNQLCVKFAGSGAETHLNGLYLNGDDHLVDNHLRIDHEATNCTSRIAYKGILDGTSRSVFTGKVHVHPSAQKTDSMQVNNNLLLSEAARVETHPQLEIYADDVKCTHGATVGPPPEEIVFYFRSRGIDEKTARGMLTYGFAGDVIGRIPEVTLRRRLEGILYGRFNPDKNG